MSDRDIGGFFALWSQKNFDPPSVSLSVNHMVYRKEKVKSDKIFSLPAQKPPHAFLVLVRHGESEWNARGLWTGLTDVHLTQKGRKEAEQAARLLHDISFHISFTSTLLRTHETLDAIVSTLRMRDMPIIRHSALNERHYGIYTGKNKWEVKKAVGEEEFLKIRRSWDYPTPGGESLKDVHGRVVPYYQSTIHAHIKAGKNVLIVAHGNSLRALVKHLENVSDERIAEIEIATGEVIVYHFSSTGRMLKKERRSFKRGGL